MWLLLLPAGPNAVTTCHLHYSAKPQEVWPASWLIAPGLGHRSHSVGGQQGAEPPTNCIAGTGAIRSHHKNWSPHLKMSLEAPLLSGTVSGWQLFLPIIPPSMLSPMPGWALVTLLGAPVFFPKPPPQRPTAPHTQEASPACF